jgi:hypothetical protein
MADFDNSKKYGKKISMMTYIPPEAQAAVDSGDDIIASADIDIYAFGMMIAEVLQFYLLGNSQRSQKLH